jgi:TonB family protein
MATVSSDEKRSDKVIAAGTSFGIFILLLLVLYKWIIYTPIPPFETSPVEFIELGTLDLGNNIEGMGNVDNNGMGEGTGDESNTKPLNSGDPQPSNDDYLTDDSDPTAAVKTNPNPSKNTSSTQEPKPDDDLNDALAALKNSKGQGSGGDGNKNGPGDKGVPGGDPNGGDHPGGGPGKGAGYSLKGRLMLKRPDPVYDSQEEGKVVVAIVVDENGKVIKAEPGEPGSTTTSAILYAKARQAAMTAKFNPSPDGIPEQRGTITFVFVLQ